MHNKAKVFSITIYEYNDEKDTQPLKGKIINLPNYRRQD